MNRALTGFTSTIFAEMSALAARIDAHHAAGADQVVLQFIPPPRAQVVLDRITAEPIAPR